MERLEALNLSRTRVTDAGLAALPLSRFTRLTDLALSQTKIGDLGFQQIAQCRSLKRLTLIGTHLDDTALRHLAQLQGLKQLILDSTDITDAGLAMDRIEWASAEIERKAKTRAPFDNPAGFIVYVLQTEHPVPASFLSSRRLALIRQAEQEAEQEAALRAQAELERYQWQERYEAFVAQTTDAYINEHIGPELLKKRLGAMRRKLAQNNAQARGWPEPVIEEYTLRLLREELARDLDLPSFDAYREIGADKLF